MTIQVMVNRTGMLPEKHFVECESCLTVDEALEVAEETISCQIFADGIAFFESLQSSVYVL